MSYGSYMYYYVVASILMSGIGALSWLSSPSEIHTQFDGDF